MNSNSIPKGIGIVISSFLFLFIIPSVLAEITNLRSGLQSTGEFLQGGDATLVSSSYYTGVSLTCPSSYTTKLNGNTYSEVFCFINWIDGWGNVLSRQSLPDGNSCSGFPPVYAGVKYCAIFGIGTPTRWTLTVDFVDNPTAYYLIGTVLTTENIQKLESVNVQIYKGSNIVGIQPIAETLTDSQGIFTLTIPAENGDYEVWLSKPNYECYLLNAESQDWTCVSESNIVKKITVSGTANIGFFTFKLTKQKQCAQNIVFDGTSTLCCDANNKVTEPIYTDNTKYKVGDSCPDIDIIKPKTDWSKYLPFILIGAGLFLWKRK